MSVDIVAIIMILVTLMISVSVHEAMHAYVSHWLGDTTAKDLGRLTLNPLAHIDPLTTVAMPILMAMAGLPPLGAAKPVPFNPQRVRYDEYGVALVSIAGPLTNLVLGIFSGLWLRFVIGIEAGLATDFFFWFTWVNISFFVFNMIPWPPLDGSRVLFSVAPDWLRNIMRTLERQGLFGFFIFFIFFYQFISPTVVNVINWIGSLILGVS